MKLVKPLIFPGNMINMSGGFSIYNLLEGLNSERDLMSFVSGRSHAAWFRGQVVAQLVTPTY